MIHADVEELQTALSTYLDRVRAGEQVVVTDQGQEIARLVPAAAGLASLSEEDLVRRGFVILPERNASPEFWRRPRIADPEGLLLQAVLAEREEGR